MRLPGYRVAIAVLFIAALLGSLLGLLVYNAASAQVRSAVASQTMSTATAAASTLSATVQTELQMVATIAGEEGLPALLERSAPQPTVNAVEYANIAIQRAYPQLLGLYFYNHAGVFVMSQEVNPTHQPPHQLSITCDSTNTYCIDTNPPTGAYLGSAALQAGL